MHILKFICVSKRVRCKNNVYNKNIAKYCSSSEILNHFYTWIFNVHGIIQNT